jgi:hypothetical protein
MLAVKDLLYNQGLFTSTTASLKLLVSGDIGDGQKRSERW